MKIDLSIEEIKIILNWSEQASQGIYSIGESFVMVDEDKLITKLQNLLKPADQNQKQDNKQNG